MATIYCLSSVPNTTMEQLQIDPIGSGPSYYSGALRRTSKYEILLLPEYSSKRFKNIEESRAAATHARNIA